MGTKTGGIVLAVLLLAGAADAQLFRYMGRGWGYGAVPQETVTTPWGIHYAGPGLVVAGYDEKSVRGTINGRDVKLADLPDRGVGVARDASDGRIYVTTINRKLFVVESGIVRQLPQIVAWPQAVAVFQGLVFVADRQTGQVVRFAGNACTAAACPFAVVVQAGQLNNPTGLFYRSGLPAFAGLYIVEQNAHRVRRLDLNGNLSTIAGNGTMGNGGDGGSALAAQLSFPGGVVVDVDGTVYIADSSNHRVRRVRAGTITTFAGSGSPQNPAPIPPDGGTNPLTFALPQVAGVALDEMNRVLYVSSTILAEVVMLPLGMPQPTATNTVAEPTETATTRPTDTPQATRTATATWTGTHTPTPLPTCFPTQGQCIET